MAVRDGRLSARRAPSAFAARHETVHRRHRPIHRRHGTVHHFGASFDLAHRSSHPRDGAIHRGDGSTHQRGASFRRRHGSFHPGDGSFHRREEMVHHLGACFRLPSPSTRRSIRSGSAALATVRARLRRGWWPATPRTIPHRHGGAGAGARSGGEVTLAARTWHRHRPMPCRQTPKRLRHAGRLILRSGLLARALPR